MYSDAAAFVLTGIPLSSSGKSFMYYHHGSMRHKYGDRIAYRKCVKIIAVS